MTDHGNFGRTGACHVLDLLLLHWLWVLPFCTVPLGDYCDWLSWSIWTRFLTHGFTCEFTWIHMDSLLRQLCFCLLTSYTEDQILWGFLGLFLSLMLSDNRIFNVQFTASSGRLLLQVFPETLLSSRRCTIPSILSAHFSSIEWALDPRVISFIVETLPLVTVLVDPGQKLIWSKPGSTDLRVREPLVKVAHQLMADSLVRVRSAPKSEIFGVLAIMKSKSV